MGRYSEHHAQKRIFSCIGCRARKIKCDRQFNCSKCVQRDIPCVWAMGEPSPSKRDIKLEEARAEIERLKNLVDVLLEQLRLRNEEYLPLANIAVPNEIPRPARPTQTSVHSYHPENGYQEGNQVAQNICDPSPMSGNAWARGPHFHPSFPLPSIPSAPPSPYSGETFAWYPPPEAPMDVMPTVLHGPNGGVAYDTQSGRWTGGAGVWQGWE